MFDRDLNSLLLFFLLFLVFPFELPAQNAKNAPIKVLAAGPEPFFFLDDDGRLAGYEYEILRSFAEAQGRELEVLWVERFRDVLPKLAAGEGDLAAAALTITEERLKHFAFSSPHFPIMLVLVERRGEESDDLSQLADRRVATQKNSSYEQRLRHIDEIKLVYLQPTQRLFEAVRDGEADATAVDSSIYLWHAERYPSLTLTLGLSETEHYGFALPPQSPFLDSLNEHIEHLKHTGKLREFLHRAFGRWGEESIDEMAEGFLDH